MSNRRKRGVKMINLWFLWFLQECQRNCWELKLVIVHFRQPWLESLALGCLDFDRTVLDASVSRSWSQERACWCTRQPWLRRSVAGHDTSQLVQFGIGGGHQELSRARYPVCKRSSRLMSSKREGIVRPIASLTRSPWHLGFPIHKGASFLFLRVKVRFVRTKTLLATKKEQP
jgi:hypothetical protein